MIQDPTLFDSKKVNKRISLLLLSSLEPKKFWFQSSPGKTMLVLFSTNCWNTTCLGAIPSPVIHNLICWKIIYGLLPDQRNMDVWLCNVLTWYIQPHVASATVTTVIKLCTVSLPHPSYSVDITRGLCITWRDECGMKRRSRQLTSGSLSMSLWNYFFFLSFCLFLVYFDNSYWLFTSLYFFLSRW